MLNRENTVASVIVDLYLEETGEDDELLSSYSANLKRVGGYFGDTEEDYRAVYSNLEPLKSSNSILKVNKIIDFISLLPKNNNATSKVRNYYTSKFNHILKRNLSLRPATVILPVDRTALYNLTLIQDSKGLPSLEELFHMSPDRFRLAFEMLVTEAYENIADKNKLSELGGLIREFDKFLKECDNTYSIEYGKKNDSYVTLEGFGINFMNLIISKEVFKDFKFPYNANFTYNVHILYMGMLNVVDQLNALNFPVFDDIVIQASGVSSDPLV